ncbi:MAG: methyltransferase domain-containing protein [Pseudomonadota bacterium]
MTDPSSSSYAEIFDDPAHAADYRDGPARFMPGYGAMQRMAGVLLRERAGAKGNIFVHGAGGGAEIEAFARENAEWRFLGVEPAKAMLDEAAKNLQSLGARVSFHHGYAEDAPVGPFDGATSLLTLHFIEPEARRDTVGQLVRRLKPGAPFICAHVSFPQSAGDRDVWLDRHQAFSTASGMDPALAAEGRGVIADEIYALDPATDERILRDAGLRDVTAFYAAFTWRGWVGYAP